MHDRFQPLQRRRIRENARAERLPIDRAIRREDVIPEGVHDRVMYRFAGIVQVMHNGVGINIPRRPKLQQHLADGGLATGDVAGQPQEMWHGG